VRNESYYTTIVAEKLRASAVGVYSTDVEELARMGTDREWVAGARRDRDLLAGRRVAVLACRSAPA
jgi:hypothetical protein